MVKKIFKILGIILLVSVLAVNLYAILSGKTYFYKALRYNLADVDDYKIFNNRKISKSTKPQTWPLAASYNKTTLSPELKATMEKYKTFAFLVFKNDSLMYEEYHDGYSQTSFSNSFSVAKSILSILIGIAVKEERIKNIDEPVANYLSDFNLMKGRKLR